MTGDLRRESGDGSRGTGVGGRELAGVTLLYSALAVAMAVPWSLHPASRVVNDTPDTQLFLWTLAWNAHAFVAHPLAIFDANIYFPYANTLAYSENLIGSALLAAPAIWITGNVVLALNLVVLASCMLCGVGAYLLARNVGLGRPAAVLAGLVFAFAPSRFFRLGQLHLATVQWVPFCLAFAHAYLDRGRARDLRLAAAFFTLQVLASGHGAAFLAVSLAVLVVYRLAMGDALAPVRRLTDLGVAGALLLAPAVLLIVPYRRVQIDMGLRRTLENWTVTPISYVASPAHVHQYLLSFFTKVDLGEAASAFLFPGCLPLLLCLAARLPGPSTAPLRARLRTSPVALYGLLGLLTVLLFVPPPFSLWPAVYWLPGFNFVRVPSRFVILTTLALAIVMAAAFERLAAAWRPEVRLAAAWILGAALIAEFAVAPLRGADAPAAIPAIDRWLDSRPKPFVVAEAPVPSRRNLSRYERFETRAMLHSMAHWQKTVHGYSGIRPPDLEQLYETLAAFPDEASIAALRERGVTYVVVHPGLYAPEYWRDIESRLAGARGITLLHQEAGDRVYAVDAP